MKQRMKKAISLQKVVEKAGYKYAFENYDLKVPAKYERNELLKKWFTEGFKSNKKQRKFEKKGIKRETAGSHSSIRVSYQVNIKNIKSCTNKQLKR